MYTDHKKYKKFTYLYLPINENIEQFQEADMAVAPLVQSSVRSLVVDFTAPFLVIGTGE